MAVSSSQARADSEMPARGLSCRAENFLDEIMGQELDILEPLPQGGKFNRDDI